MCGASAIRCSGWRARQNSRCCDCQAATAVILPILVAEKKKRAWRCAKARLVIRRIRAANSDVTARSLARKLVRSDVYPWAGSLGLQVNTGPNRLQATGRSSCRIGAPTRGNLVQKRANNHVVIIDILRDVAFERFHMLAITGERASATRLKYELALWIAERWRRGKTRRQL